MKNLGKALILVVLFISLATLTLASNPKQVTDGATTETLSYSTPRVYLVTYHEHRFIAVDGCGLVELK